MKEVFLLLILATPVGSELPPLQPVIIETPDTEASPVWHETMQECRKAVMAANMHPHTAAFSTETGSDLYPLCIPVPRPEESIWPSTPIGWTAYIAASLAVGFLMMLLLAIVGYFASGRAVAESLWR